MYNYILKWEMYDSVSLNKTLTSLTFPFVSAQPSRATGYFSQEPQDIKRFLRYGR